MSKIKVAVGDRILVQRLEFVKEIAVVKEIFGNGNLLVRYSDGAFVEINPQYILKSFGQL